MSFGIMLTPEHTKDLIYILDILDRMENQIRVFNPHFHSIHHQSSSKLLADAINFLQGTYPEVEPLEPTDPA
jgi:hypothetical protein